MTTLFETLPGDPKPVAVFLRPGPGDYDSMIALRVNHDDGSLTITKGPALDGWLGDESPCRRNAGMVTHEVNVASLAQFIENWLRGQPNAGWVLRPVDMED